MLYCTRCLPRGNVFTTAGLPAWAYDPRVVYHFIICNARCALHEVSATEASCSPLLAFFLLSIRRRCGDHLIICSAGCCIAQGVCPRGVVFAPGCLPARGKRPTSGSPSPHCSARCCGVPSVRPRGIVSDTVSRPGRVCDTLVAHHLHVCSARCCGARGVRLRCIVCADACIPAYVTRVVYRLPTARKMMHCSMCSP